MTMQTDRPIVRRILDQAFNQGNLAIVDELVAAGLVTHLKGWGLPSDRIGFKLFITTFRSAFPDLHCAIDDEIQVGNRFAAHWTMHGTHHGFFLGSPPTGRLVDVKGILFGRAIDGQIVEIWMLIDQIGILQQLGIVPPPSGH